MSDKPNKSKRILRRPKVTLRTGYSRSSIYAKMALGQFPAAINLGGRAVGWIESEIEDWIDARVEASREGESEAAQ